MEWLDDSALAELFGEPESQSVERKSSGSDRSGIRKNICAFANDLADRRRPGAAFSIKCRWKWGFPAEVPQAAGA